MERLRTDEKLVRLKLDTHRDLKILAATHGVTLDEVVKLAIVLLKKDKAV